MMAPKKEKARSSSVHSGGSASDNESLHGNDEAERNLSAPAPSTGPHGMSIGTINLPTVSSSSSSSGGLSRTPSTPVLTITPSANIVNAIRNRDERKKDKEAVDLTIYTRPETGEKVSTMERIVKDVPAPAVKKPTDDQFWTIKNEKPNIEFLKQHFTLEGRLTTEQATWLVNRGTELLKAEPNLLELEGPITICGDIHGQFFDLLKLFEVGGSPLDVKYLFLGDYVDRGYFSIECTLYLWALKICYPDRIFLLRGNHECKHLTEYFTFKLECIHKYSEQLYESVLESFCALPLSATVNKQFICVHGGISPDWGQVEEINEIDRFREPPTHGLMCDVLWADPLEDYDRSKGEEHFVHNDQRGCSYYYSYAAVCAFLERNNLLSLIRAHEVQDPGYRLYKARKSTNFASMITLFSAPNYLDTYKNKAAVLRYDTNTMNIRQFSWSPHPYWLPNFMDVFTWSLPFVGEKVTDMLLAIVSICSREELEEELAARKSRRKARIVIKMPEEDNAPGVVAMEGVESMGSIPELTVTSPESGTTTEGLPPPTVLTKEKRQAMRNKLRAVGKLGGMFRVLREEAEALSELKNLMGSARLPAGSLALGAEGIRQAILTFEEARRADRDNERYPTPEPERPASPQAGPQDQKTLTGSLKRAPSLKSVQNLKREKLVNDDEQLEAAIEYMDLDAEAQSGERFD